MDSGINTVLRIFIIIFCVILAVSLFYVFTVKYLDGYYSPDKDDAFMTSMQIRDIFPMDDGSLFVVGSYLEGDDILSNTSIFVKTYDRSGKPVNIGGFSGRYGFEYRQADVWQLLQTGTDRSRSVSYQVQLHHWQRWHLQFQPCCHR